MAPTQMSFSDLRLLVVCGPTAAGKTQAAIQLANHYNAPIINFDSRQFFRELNIGTAKPTLQQLQSAPHFLINNLSITQPYNAGQFAHDAHRLIAELAPNHSIIILCGGSGLYIHALLFGMNNMPEVSLAIRQQVLQLYRTQGLAHLQQAVQECDAEYFEIVDKNNPQRLMRALEIFMQTGNPFSFYRSKENEVTPYRYFLCGLTRPRNILYQLIDDRVDEMIANGLEQEVRGCLPFRHHHALQTVGYREMFDYIDGKSDLHTSIKLIKQHTRNYAKRQITWFNRYEKLQWLTTSDEQGIVKQVAHIMCD